MTRLKRQNPRSFSPTPNNKHIRDHPTTETLAFHMKHLLEPLPHLSALPLEPPHSRLPLQINKQGTLEYKINKIASGKPQMLQSGEAITEIIKDRNSGTNPCAVLLCVVESPTIL
jgi:hypothetical protein